MSNITHFERENTTDEAQENGGVATRADGAKLRDHIPGENKIATVRELGLTSKAIHEARLIRDAEESDPGIVNRTLQEALDNDEEPTRAKVKRAVLGQEQTQAPAEAQL
jgi:hypothetical protein